MRADLRTVTRVDVIHAAFAVGDLDLVRGATWSLFESGEIRPVFAMLRELFGIHSLVADFRDMQRRAALSRIGGARPTAAGAGGSDGAAAPEAGPGTESATGQESEPAATDPVDQGEGCGDATADDPAGRAPDA